MNRRDFGTSRRQLPPLSPSGTSSPAMSTSNQGTFQPHHQQRHQSWVMAPHREQQQDNHSSSSSSGNNDSDEYGTTRLPAYAGAFPSLGDVQNHQQFLPSPQAADVEVGLMAPSTPSSSTFWAVNQNNMRLSGGATAAAPPHAGVGLRGLQQDLLDQFDQQQQVAVPSHNHHQQQQQQHYYNTATTATTATKMMAQHPPTTITNQPSWPTVPTATPVASSSSSYYDNHHHDREEPQQQEEPFQPTKLAMAWWAGRKRMSSPLRNNTRPSQQPVDLDSGEVWETTASSSSPTCRPSHEEDEDAQTHVTIKTDDDNATSFSGISAATSDRTPIRDNRRWTAAQIAALEEVGDESRSTTTQSQSSSSAAYQVDSTTLSFWDIRSRQGKIVYCLLALLVFAVGTVAVSGLQMVLDKNDEQQQQPSPPERPDYNAPDYGFNNNNPIASPFPIGTVSTLAPSNNQAVNQSTRVPQQDEHEASSSTSAPTAAPTAEEPDFLPDVPDFDRIKDESTPLSTQEPPTTTVTSAPTLVPTSVLPAPASMLTPPPESSRTRLPLLTETPTTAVTAAPSDSPTVPKLPTISPTAPFTDAPTASPTASPTISPTATPTAEPTPAPSIPVTHPPTVALESIQFGLEGMFQGDLTGDSFGSSVAVAANKDALLVGAPNAIKATTGVGTVRLFDRTKITSQWRRQHGTTVWVEQSLDSLERTTEQSKSDSSFGSKVATNHDASIIAVADPSHVGITAADDKAGLVQVFRKNTMSQSYEPLGQALVGPAKSAFFGVGLALSRSGTRLAVGAPYYSTGTLRMNGAVFVYELVENRDNTKEWKQLGEPLLGTSTLDWFGSAIQLSGSTIVASAPRNPSARGYVRSWNWNEEKRTWERLGNDITNTQGMSLATDRFGHSLSLAISTAGKPRVAVGIPFKDTPDMANSGMVAVYELNQRTDEWTLLGGPLSGENSGDDFGYSVQLGNDGLLAIGAPGAKSVMIFRYNESAAKWEQHPKSIGGDAERSDQFGYAIAMSETTNSGSILAIGAKQPNGGTGYVRVYNIFSSES